MTAPRFVYPLARMLSQISSNLLLYPLLSFQKVPSWHCFCLHCFFALDPPKPGCPCCHLPVCLALPVVLSLSVLGTGRRRSELGMSPCLSGVKQVSSRLNASNGFSMQASSRRSLLWGRSRKICQNICRGPIRCGQTTLVWTDQFCGVALNGSLSWQFALAGRVWW